MKKWNHILLESLRKAKAKYLPQPARKVSFSFTVTVEGWEHDGLHPADTCAWMYAEEALDEAISQHGFTMIDAFYVDHDKQYMPPSR